MTTLKEAQNIIDDIQEFLQRTNISQVEFAKRLGCPHPTVSRWLNGHNIPSPAWQNLIRAQLKKKK